MYICTYLRTYVLYLDVYRLMDITTMYEGLRITSSDRLTNAHESSLKDAR